MRGLLYRGVLQAVMMASCAAQTPTNPSPTQDVNRATSTVAIPRENVVVTVTGEALPVSASSASVTVLSRELIQESAAANAVDLLRQVPFLYLSQAGGRGGLTTITLRGAKPNLVLVMIDGVPVNDITDVLGGSFDFSTLSLDNVEQIEIVRGPMSSLYGSQAIAGVINIVSRRHEDASTAEFGVEGGNFSSIRTTANVAERFKGTDYILGGSYFNLGQQIGLDHYSLGTGTLGSTTDLNRQRVLQFNARFQQRQYSGYPEGSGGPEFAILHEAERDRSQELVLGGSYRQQWNSWWSYSVNLNAFHRSDENFTPAILDQVPPSSQSLPSAKTNTGFRRLELGISNNFKLGSLWTAQLGLTATDEDGNSDGLISGTLPANFHLRRDTLQLNGEILYHSRRLTTSLGMSVDKTGGFSDVISPRAGANLQVARNTHLKGSWGQGFNLPSFYALGYPIIGNPKLKPEYSNGFDVGITQNLLRNRVKSGLTYFHTYTRNLIDFSPQAFQLVNRSAVRTQGGEFDLQVSITDKLGLGANASHLEWSIVNSTEPLRNVPHWTGGINLDWSPSRRLHSRVETVVVGRRFDFQIPVPEQTSVGGYETSSVAVTYQVTDQLTSDFRADNFFNSHYHEFIGFPNPGIYVRGGLTYRFGHSVRGGPK